MTTNDDEFFEAPSGIKYHLPPGQEVARIDSYLRRMQMTHNTIPEDVDFLLDARVLLAATTETGDTP